MQKAWKTWKTFLPLVLLLTSFLFWISKSEMLVLLPHVREYKRSRTLLQISKPSKVVSAELRGKPKMTICGPKQGCAGQAARRGVTLPRCSTEASGAAPGAAAPPETRHWKGSIPRPGGQGRGEGRRVGSAVRTATSPRAGTWLRRARARHTRGALPRRAERRARPAPRRDAALPRECSRTPAPLPRPRACFLLGRPLPAWPRPPSWRGVPSPALGADGAAGLGPTHRPAGAPASEQRQRQRRQQEQREQREPARPGDGSAGGSEVAPQGNSAVSGGWRGMPPRGFFPCPGSSAGRGSL